MPHDPQKAMELYQKTCDMDDSFSCYTLAAMLLRGGNVNKETDNVSPQEARGEVPLKKRQNENREPSDEFVIKRDPPRAAKLLEQACERGINVASCHNLAVMYKHGDDGVPADPEKAEKYAKMTEENMYLWVSRTNLRFVLMKFFFSHLLVPS
jgi:TPR repeat protein